MIYHIIMFLLEIYYYSEVQADLILQNMLSLG
jgi:hypothetical protein